MWGLVVCAVRAARVCVSSTSVHARKDAARDGLTVCADSKHIRFAFGKILQSALASPASVFALKYEAELSEPSGLAI